MGRDSEHNRELHRKEGGGGKIVRERGRKGEIERENLNLFLFSFILQRDREKRKREREREREQRDSQTDSQTGGWGGKEKELKKEGPTNERALCTFKTLERKSDVSHDWLWAV